MIVDLIDLISHDTELKKVASTCGGEWSGPCPFCGGKDRLRVQPAMGRWWCRQCSPSEKWENAAAYIAKKEKCSYSEAARRLSNGDTKKVEKGPSVRVQSEPTAEWREKCRRIIVNCRASLESMAGERAMTYLQGRGLSDTSIRQWWLGYNLGAREIEGLFVPAGILIPWFANGELWHVKVRSLDTDNSYKYTSIKGGHPFLFGADMVQGKEFVVLCEGEFDCMLLSQECLIPVATLGGCSVSLTSRARKLLQGAQTIALLYDNDEEGQKWAGKLAATDNRMVRLALPDSYGKDVTDAHLAGINLYEWLSEQIAVAGATQLSSEMRREFYWLTATKNVV